MIVSIIEISTGSLGLSAIEGLVKKRSLHFLCAGVAAVMNLFI